ncbi:MAG: nucleotidyltransferase domain-containing protein [Elusimicrobiota bacterium]
MAKKTDIKIIVQEFVEQLSKVIHIKAVYLFGSYANGKQNEYSDIDIAIISKDFSGFRYDDRQKINPVVLHTNINIETHPITIKEFNSKNPFIKEILRTGKRIV